MATAKLTHHTARANGIDLHYVEAGTGPLVLLLHGFPEFWYSWRHQLPALAKAGFRAVAVDMRGYNLSAKPRGASNYRVPALLNDIQGLIVQLGADRAHLVGHDWGGMLAWGFAMHHPEHVSSLTAMNAPHPRAYSEGLRHPSQVMRSWYTLAFQLPWFPEWFIRSNDFALVDRAVVGRARRDVDRAATAAAYKDALRVPDALTSAINYYRAFFRHKQSRGVLFADRVVDMPTLLIWGDRDPYLRKQLADRSSQWARKLRVEHLDAGHGVQNDAPDAVNALLLEFLSAQR